MRTQLFVLKDLGGWLWWVLIRQCRTDLKEERTTEYWARNIFFLIVICFLIALLTLKVVPFVKELLV